MHPHEPVDKDKEAAKRKVLAFFSQAAADKLKENDAHPAMRVVMGKHGPKLKTYIAEGAERLTGMHVLKQGDIKVVLGDMLKAADAYYPHEPGAVEGKVESRSHKGTWHNLLYYSGSTPKDIVGTYADIKKWFAEHDDHAFVIKQEDDYFDTGENVEGFTAEVRLVSFKAKGGKDYVDLGGVGTAAIEALKGLLGVGTAGIGNVYGELSKPAAQAVKDLSGAAPDVYEQATTLTGREPKLRSGEYRFDRELAEKYLELAVTVHEGEGPIRDGEFVTHHVWKEVPERGIKPESSDEYPKYWPVISVRRIGRRVVGELIPRLFDELEAAVT